jgi:hypothetical protein
MVLPGRQGSGTRTSPGMAPPGAFLIVVPGSGIAKAGLCAAAVLSWSRRYLAFDASSQAVMLRAGAWKLPHEVQLHGWQCSVGRQFRRQKTSLDVLKRNFPSSPRTIRRLRPTPLANAPTAKRKIRSRRHSKFRATDLTEQYPIPLKLLRVVPAGFLLSDSAGREAIPGTKECASATFPSSQNDWQRRSCYRRHLSLKTWNLNAELGRRRYNTAPDSDINKIVEGRKPIVKARGHVRIGCSGIRPAPICGNRELFRTRPTSNSGASDTSPRRVDVGP